MSSSDDDESVRAVQAVVQQIMDAFRPAIDEDDEWQFSNTFEESAGSAYRGCRVLLSSSVKTEDEVDELGRLQPGAFARPGLLERHLLAQDNYRSLACAAATFISCKRRNWHASLLDLL